MDRFGHTGGHAVQHDGDIQGLAELAEGEVGVTPDGLVLRLRSTSVSGAASAKDVRSVERSLTVRDRIAAELSGDVEVLTGEEITEENQDGIAEALTFFSIFLGVFAGVALVVSVFSIYIRKPRPGHRLVMSMPTAPKLQSLP